MKKVSTASAKQIRNLSQQRLTIGLDLGDRSSHYCVLDETGHIVVESKTLSDQIGEYNPYLRISWMIDDKSPL